MASSTFRPLTLGLCVLSLLIATPASGQVRTVQLDGFSVRVLISGLENRVAGRPVVIFENGASNTLDTWEPLLGDVEEFAPVVAYDRAGFGGSAWDSIPPTPGHVAGRLHDLLVLLEVAPPYVLVGHSWGGRFIHQFAGTYPGEVAGLVYIDPTDFTQTPAETRAILEAVAPGDAALEWYRQEQAAIDQAAERLSGVMGVGLRLVTEHQRSNLESRGLLSQPDVPTTVILANPEAGEPPSQELLDSFPFDLLEYERATFRARVEKLRRWARSGEFIIAPTAQHLVHAEKPELVADAIRRVVSPSDR